MNPIATAVAPITRDSERNDPATRSGAPLKRTPPRRSLGWLIGLLLLGLIAGSIYYAKTRQSEPEGKLATVTRGEVSEAVQEVGSIEPFRKIEIKSKVPGQVRRVAVDVGDSVKAGQVLMQLDPLDADREVMQASAREDIAKAQLAEQQAQFDFKKKAHDNGALSDVDFALAQGELKRLQAEVTLNAANALGAQDRLSYTLLKSPIDGVVLARNVQPGEMVTPGVSSMVDGKPLLVVAQIEQFLIRTELNQIDVARLHQGDAAEVRVDALPGKRFSGKIYRIAAMAQKSERRKESNLQVFPVDLLVSRSETGAEALRPGMMADITIGLETHKNVLFVPLEAVVHDKSKTQLWKVVGKGTPDLAVDVVVGLQNDHQAEIISGMLEGDTIRVRPADASGQVGK